MLYLFSFTEHPRKFIIAELSIRKLGSSSVLICNNIANIISTDEDPSLRIENSAIIDLRGVSTKLNKYIVFTMQTYKKLIKFNVTCKILILCRLINIFIICMIKLLDADWLRSVQLFH